MLLLGAAWVVAQNYPSQTSPSQTNPDQTTPTATGAQTTVQGCLSGSSGNYILTDKNGNTYQLTGDTSKLNEHVGHEVQIKGTASSASASAGTTSGTASSTTGQKSGSSQQMLDVSSSSTYRRLAKAVHPVRRLLPISRPSRIRLGFSFASLIIRQGSSRQCSGEGYFRGRILNQ